jgi:hypothetical protein
MMRRRAGFLLALGYLICVIGPPLALTLADSARAAHCLTDEHHAVAPVHVHADGSSHSHGTPAPAQSQNDHDETKTSATCCGLFCLNAAVADAEVTFGVVPRADMLLPTLAPALGGIGPFRIDRPPNSLLPI